MKTNHYVKTTAILLAILFNVAFLQAQDVAGHWNSVLRVQGTNLRLIFNITKTDAGYTSTMDSPDQGALGIPIATTVFDGSKLSLAVPAIGFSYEGEFKTDSIVGTFKQGGLSLPLTLHRTTTEIKPPARPQEPKPPFPYRSEDVTFENKTAGITLAGTLTMPQTGNNFTAVILISGSGAQDRNQEIMGHKPFLVIADYLTRQGIAVLRYDDRGTAQSTGNFATATTADFATDVESAIAYLKTRNEINHRKIGLIGHSEGGVIAPMVASQSEDVAFIVMLAGTGLRGDKILLLQNELVSRAMGMPEDQIKRGNKVSAMIYDKIINAEELASRQEMTDFIMSLKNELVEFLPQGLSVNDYIRNLAMQMSSPWMQYFIRHDPSFTLEKVRCPVFAVTGSKDLQVPAKENLTAISRALERGGNTKVTIREYPGLNHLFQECTTGLPTKYATIEQTFSPIVLRDLVEWIKSQ